jgi:cell division protein FtsB
MKTMEERLLEKIAEKQAEIDELTAKNAELEQLVADLASLQLEVLMNG